MGQIRQPIALFVYFLRMSSDTFKQQVQPVLYKFRRNFDENREIVCPKATKKRNYLICTFLEFKANKPKLPYLEYPLYVNSPIFPHTEIFILSKVPLLRVKVSLNPPLIVILVFVNRTWFQ